MAPRGLGRDYLFICFSAALKPENSLWNRLYLQATTQSHKESPIFLYDDRACNQHKSWYWNKSILFKSSLIQFNLIWLYYEEFSPPMCTQLQQQPLIQKRILDFNGSFKHPRYLLTAPQLCTSKLLAATAAKVSQASARLRVPFSWISLFFESTLDKECISEEQRAPVDNNTAHEHADPSLEWICFIKLNNKCLRGLDICRLSSSFTLESYRAAPYGAIPYCIMQCCNRLRLCADLQGRVLGRLWWLTSLSLPPSELRSCWGINFLHPRFSTNLGRHEQRET